MGFRSRVCRRKQITSSFMRATSFAGTFSLRNAQAHECEQCFFCAHEAMGPNFSHEVILRRLVFFVGGAPRARHRAAVNARFYT